MEWIVIAEPKIDWINSYVKNGKNSEPKMDWNNSYVKNRKNSEPKKWIGYEASLSW